MSHNLSGADALVGRVKPKAINTPTRASAPLIDAPVLKAPPRAMTLVELLVALTLVAVLSTAVTTMLAGAGDTNQYVLNETDAMSQVENAYRRILHNVRTASALTTPADSSLHSPGTLTVLTQVDPNHGNVAATVTYSLSGGNLIETDSRYNTAATLVPNVSTFSVQQVGTTPTRLCITITSGTTPPVTRSATITCRNF